MEQFSEIFTLPESPNPEYNPRENVLNWIREMDDAHEAERWEAHTRTFLLANLNDVETGHLSMVNETGDTLGAGGGLPPQTPPPQPWQDQVHFVNEYNSFNLANITPPITPKWKQPDNLLEEFRKLKCSCMRIFDVPMCHITSGKVKTNMLLIWAGPDGEGIYDSFNLRPDQANDVGHVLQRFEDFCEPICNFRAAQIQVY